MGFKIKGKIAYSHSAVVKPNGEIHYVVKTNYEEKG